MRGPNFIVGPGPDTPVIVGALLEMIVALAGIGTAVALYPVVKRQGEARALGFVGSRVLEAATIYVGIVSLMSIVTLRQAGAGAGALATGQGLAAQYYWSFFFATELHSGRERRVAGLPAVPVAPGAAVASRAGIHRSGPARRFLVRHAVRVLGTGNPGVGARSHSRSRLWEFSLGVYLIFWGFKPSPITAGM